jgi:hypothetical protein
MVGHSTAFPLVLSPFCVPSETASTLALVVCFFLAGDEENLAFRVRPAPVEAHVLELTPNSWVAVPPRSRCSTPWAPAGRRRDRGDHSRPACVIATGADEAETVENMRSDRAAPERPSRRRPSCSTAKRGDRCGEGVATEPDCLVAAQALGRRRGRRARSDRSRVRPPIFVYVKQVLGFLRCACNEASCVITAMVINNDAPPGRWKICSQPALAPISPIRPLIADVPRKRPGSGPVTHQASSSGGGGRRSPLESTRAHFDLARLEEILTGGTARGGASSSQMPYARVPFRDALTS